MESKGKIIVIEGTDGAGKGTQVGALLKKAKAEGFNCTSFDFPVYGTTTGRGIENYLSGKFGDPVKLSPKLSAGYYAPDRLDAVPRINYQLINKERVIFMNRYSGSNFAHQAAKLPQSKRGEFVQWCKDYEYGHLGIPRPDLFICLHVPAEISADSVVLRGLERDGHESNFDYQKEVVKTYLWLAKNERDWRLVNCMNGKKRKSVEEITEEIWEHVSPILGRKSLILR